MLFILVMMMMISSILNFGYSRIHNAHKPNTRRDAFSHRPCVPSEGYTALMIGQDLFSITNYTTAIGILPFGFMSYTALKSDSGNLIMTFIAQMTSSPELFLQVRYLVLIILSTTALV